ncbi:hypothetical protein Trydic_g15519 [Trypoxylus dichotomus]
MEKDDAMCTEKSAVSALSSTDTEQLISSDAVLRNCKEDLKEFLDRLNRKSFEIETYRGSQATQTVITKKTKALGRRETGGRWTEESS